MKLFVRNIPYSYTNDQLKAVFEQVGPVASAKVVVDRDSGSSRGFGFVEMASRDDAKKAIAELNGKEVDGRELVVDVARDNPRDSNRGGEGRERREHSEYREYRGPRENRR